MLLYSQMWSVGLYLWRVLEVVRRRLPPAFLASVSSGGAPPGLGGLFPNREELPGTGCSMLSSRSWKSNTTQKVNHNIISDIVQTVLFNGNQQKTCSIDTCLAISFLLFSSRFSSSLLWISAMISFSYNNEAHLSQHCDLLEPLSVVGGLVDSEKANRLLR